MTLPAIVYTTWSNAHDGEVMPLKEVRERFRAYSLPTVIGVLQRIDFLLWDADRADTAVQDQIGEGLLGHTRWTALCRAFRPPASDVPSPQRRPFFWFQQLILNAAKLAFIESPENNNTEPSDLASLAEGILGLSDHLNPQLPEGQDDLLRHHVTVNGVFNAHERQITLLPLGRRLYLNRHDDLRSHPLWVDFVSLFKQATGLSPEKFLALGVSVTAYWQTLDKSRFHESVSVLDLRKYLAATSLTTADIDAFLKVASRSSDQMRQAVIDRYSPDDLRPFSFVPFAETPMVEIQNYHYCLSFKLLTRRLSTDLHYFFVQFLSDTARRKYFAFHGVAFENLVHSTFRQGLRRPKRRSSTAPLAHYYVLDELDHEEGEMRADAVLVVGDLAIVLDAKAGRFPSPVFDGEVALLETYVENSLIKAASQIDATITRLRSRTLSLGRAGRIARFVPLVVCLQTFGWNPLLAGHVAHRLREIGILQEQDTSPLQVAELETLMILSENGHGGDVTLPDILSARAADTYHEAFPLQNYLYSLGDKISWRTPRLRREMKDIFDLVAGFITPRDQ